MPVVTDSDGQFVLYSVGWNEIDDVGTLATRNGKPSEDLTQGDWIWEYSAKPGDHEGGWPGAKAHKGRSHTGNR